MASVEPTLDPIETEVLLQELHDALFHLRELPLRRGHPLCRRLGQTTPLSPVALHALLVDGIESLRPAAPVGMDSPRWRRYRYLTLRYLEGARLDQIVAELGISGRQARREHLAALHELAAQLVRRSEREQLPPPPSTAPTPPVASPRTWRAPESSGEAMVSPDLEAELSMLEASLDVEPIELAAAVKDALSLVGSFATRQGIRIHDETYAPSPRIIASPTILRQVFLNVLTHLLDNHSGDCLRVSLREADAIADVGLMLLGPRRERRSTLSGPDLPLTTAARLSEGLQAMLETDPLASGDLAVRVRFLTTRAPLILVVDDNPSMIRLFRRYLQGQELRLVQARNGIHAFQLARELQPQAILLDLMMPVQDGWDLSRSLRADPRTSTIPVIACSVLPERELALSLGADGFLAKPVSPQSVQAALKPFCRSTGPRSVAGTDPELP